MQLTSFRLRGRFAHFLRAEASASALSYPLPPRTVILGVLGAILGLQKDEPQVMLEPANIAVSGKIPQTHWHRVKLRKDPPAPLPLVIKSTQKTDKKTVPEKATLILQEWLFNPNYTIWFSVPEPYNLQLEERLRYKRWYFQPSLGLSEMMADIEYLSTDKSLPMPKGVYEIQSVFPQEAGILDIEQIFEKGLAIHSLQMPRSVMPDRIFSHSIYFMERDAKGIPVETGWAYKVNDTVLLFL